MIPYQFIAGAADNILSYLRAFLIGMKFPSIRMERNVIFKGRIGNLSFGRGVVIQSGTVIHAGGMKWCGGRGQVAIGDDSVISPNCVLYGAGSGGIKIGKRFDCGPCVGIYASRTNHQHDDGQTHVFKPVIIGDDVTVFSHVVISPGVSIGNGAVIAAGSVVLGDVPPGAMVAGAPARVID